MYSKSLALLYCIRSGILKHKTSGHTDPLPLRIGNSGREKFQDMPAFREGCGTYVLALFNSVNSLSCTYACMDET